MNAGKTLTGEIVIGSEGSWALHDVPKKNENMKIRINTYEVR